MSVSSAVRRPAANAVTRKFVKILVKGQPAKPSVLGWVLKSVQELKFARFR